MYKFLGKFLSSPILVEDRLILFRLSRVFAVYFIFEYNNVNVGDIVTTSALLKIKYTTWKMQLDSAHYTAGWFTSKFGARNQLVSHLATSTVQRK